MEQECKVRARLTELGAEFGHGKAHCNLGQQNSPDCHAGDCLTPSPGG